MEYERALKESAFDALEVWAGPIPKIFFIKDAEDTELRKWWERNFPSLYDFLESPATCMWDEPSCALLVKL